MRVILCKTERKYEHELVGDFTKVRESLSALQNYYITINAQLGGNS